jgi:hypothetical protein
MDASGKRLPLQQRRAGDGPDSGNHATEMHNCLQNSDPGSLPLGLPHFPWRNAGASPKSVLSTPDPPTGVTEP